MDDQNQNLTKKQRKELKRQAKLAYREELAQKSSLIRKIIIWGLVVIALTATVWFIGKKSATNNKPLVTGAPVNINEVTNSDRVEGNPFAPITVIEYSDFQCPYCAEAFSSLKQVMANYGQNIRLVFRNFPLMQHPYSNLAASVAEAAGLQGKFWPMHDLLFNRQKSWTQQTDVQNIFTGYAQELNLDLNKFKNDLNSPEVKNKIQADVDKANQIGVNSTPSFFINGQPLIYKDFTDLANQIIKATQPSK